MRCNIKWWLIVFAGGCLVIGLSWIHWRLRPHVRELRAHEVAFWTERIAGYQLPPVAENARGILCSFRDRQIFAEFTFQAEDLASVVDTFARHGIKMDELGRGESPGRVLPGFEHVILWQRQLGATLFDEGATSNNCLVHRRETGFGRKNEVLLDRDRCRVYIYALRPGNRWIPLWRWVLGD
jgi:hypothetical protein